MISGVFLTKNRIIENPLGNIFHILKSSSKGYCGFGEVYISSIMKNKIKGWKRHNEITINLTVIEGKVKFAIYDDRESSKTFGEINTFILGPNLDFSRLTIANGLWVAFMGYEEKNLIINVIPSEHDELEADNQPLNFINFPN